MPSNPLTQEELNSYAIDRILNPEGYTGLSPYLPRGYFFSTPATENGPALWRLFDASFISSGIIDRNRLGTGSTGAGNLYLADDGTWKLIGGGGGGGDMLKATYDVDNDGVVDSSERIEIIVRNSTGTTLTKGTVVYLNGATGNRPNAVRAQANTEATSSKTFGIVVANINNNSDGYVACNGTLHNLDTSAFADGAALWLSATTAGAYTSTIPAEPNHTVFIGYVARSHPTLGRIVILIKNGYELNELHDVFAPSPSNGDLLQWDTANAYWKNWTPNFLTSVPTLAQVTTAGNTTTDAISVGRLTVNTSSLIVFPTTFNVGINTATDAGYRLDVTGTARILNSFTVGNAVFSISGNILTLTTNASSSKFQVSTANARHFELTGGSNSSNTAQAFLITTALQNSSGTGAYNFINNTPVINTSGTYSGIVRGYYYNPTITSLTGVTDHISFQSTIGRMIVSGAVITQAGLGQGAFFNNGLVAAANSDVLVGVDVNPTFTNGAFTGVSNIALRITGAGATSTTTSLLVRNSAGTARLTIPDLGTITINADTNVQRLQVVNEGKVECTAARALNLGGTNGITITRGLAFNGSANVSAIVDVLGTNGGFLFPRLTTEQKNAIATPAAGLVVYDTTLNKLCVRTAAAWEIIPSM